MAREDILRRHRDVDIAYPNRDKPECHTARLATVALLLISAAMMAIVTIGGWGTLVGAKPTLVFYVMLYVLFAYLTWRWIRGVLPVATGSATILLIFALIAGPKWFEREQFGFIDPALPESLLGTLTLGLIPVQMLLIVVSIWAFTQQWNVEEEVPRQQTGAPAAAPPAASTI